MCTGSVRWRATTPDRWRGPTGAMRLFNTGSWIYEPLLLHGPRRRTLLAGRCDPAPPGGGAARIGLLDDLGAAELHRGPLAAPASRSLA